MEDIKKIQEFFSKPVKENSRRSPDFILIDPAEIKYTESFGSGIKAPGVLHHANEGVFLGAEGAYIIVLPGGTFYVDEDKEEAIPIYPLKDQSRELQLALDYTPFSPKYETWKSWIKRPETLEEDDEVTRYSGFIRNPEDPDSEPFKPTGSVAEFREDLRALFSKFKGDLKNPEFIKGVAEIMVNWKSLLRSQLDGVDESIAEASNLEESLNPEVSNALDRFIKAMAKRYDYSEQDAVYAIMAALKQREFDSVNELEEVTKEEYKALLDKEYELTKAYSKDKTDANWKKLSDIRKKGKKLEKELEDQGLLNENKPVANVNRHIKAIQIQLDQLGVKYEMSGNPYKPFKAVYKPINKDDKWYDNFEDIVFRYNLGGVVKTSMDEATKDEETEFHKKLDKLVHDTFGKRKGELAEAEYSKYAKLIDLVQKADNPRNLSIYYNSDFGVVNIGGVGYDKGDLVKMFRSQPGTSIDIKNIFFKANQNPEQTAKDVNSLNMGVKAEVDYGYGKEPFIKFTKGYSDEFLDQMTKDQMDHDKETLRRERGLEENKYNPDLDQDDEEVPMPMDDEGRPLGESNPDAELKVGDYQTKYFYICPGAKSLYQDIEDKVEDMGLAIRAAKLQDALFAIEVAALENGATEAEVFAAQSIADQIMAMAAMMGLDKEHSYIQGHVDKIKGAVGKEQVDEGASSEEKRMAMQAIKRFAKYRGVSEKEAKADLIRAVKELGSIEEAINEIVETIQAGKVLEEKLCKKGEAYRKRRMAAGEKSSAYLSGRAVKVCKGQMSGKKKKKK